MRNASFDMAALRDRGVTVCGTGGPGGGNEDTAELAWGLILGAARGIAEDHAFMRQGGWQTRIGHRVAGKTIVPRGDAAAAMRAIRDGKLAPIERAAPWTPPPLANAITWALQTRREHRPTAMQLAQELEAFIKSSPELATPMQLGAWLRVRFTREPTSEAGAYPSGGTQVAPSTFATPGAQPPRQGGPTGDHGSAASPGTPSVITSETTSETAAVAPLGDPADAATVLVAHRAAFEPTDPPTYVAVAITLAVVAALACLAPARRAATIDPMRALRAD
jgi:hypothetical protein